MTDTKKRPKRTTVMLRVQPDGSLRAADEMSRHVLRGAKFKVGCEIAADLRRPRNPAAWKRAHALAQLLIENTDDFGSYTDAHAVLKRLQMESGIGCDAILFRVPNAGLIEQRVPLSLSFDRMDDLEFNRVYAGFAQHVIRTYWPTLNEAQIEDMAGLVGMAA